MEYLLLSLLKSEELSLIRATVVHLGLTRYRADEVRMHSESEAQHIGSLLHVITPVSTFLLRRIIEVGNLHAAHLLARDRFDVAATDDSLAGILHTRNEVDDVLLLLLYAFLAFLLIMDILVIAEVVPIVIEYFDKHSWSTGVLDEEPLADADKTVESFTKAVERFANMQ